jgi:hypothetical protein
LPVLLLAMYLFSGGPADTHNVPVVGEVSYLNSATWGFAALASTADVRHLNHCNKKHQDETLWALSPNNSDRPDRDKVDKTIVVKELDDRCKPLWDHGSSSLLASWFALLAIGVASLFAAGWMLKSKERKHGLAG